MSLEAVRRGPVGDSLQMSQRVDSSSTDVGGVLEADQASSRKVLVVSSDLALKLFNIQKAAIGSDGE